MKKLVVLFAVLLLTAVTASGTATAQTVSKDDVARELTCMCGCYMLLPNCNHGTCGVRDQMNGIITQQIALGKTKPEIVQLFMTQYGFLDLNGNGKMEMDGNPMEMDIGMASDFPGARNFVPFREQVLAVPTKKGFNLTAWILPFVALVAGAALIYALLRLWVLKGKEQTAAEVVPTVQDDEYRRKLEEDLKKHKGGFA